MTLSFLTFPHVSRSSFIYLLLATLVTTRARAAHNPRNHDFQILSEELLYKNWRTVTRRTVQLPSQRTVDFEIVGQKGSDQAVLVFVWDSHRKVATLIQEYMPALHEKVIGLAAGMVEEHKHQSDLLVAAKQELEEECHLTGGIWTQLCEPTCMDKYSSTRLCVFLCTDPTQIHPSQVPERDEAEEGMQVLPNVTPEQLQQWIREGRMTVVGGWAAQLALQKLQDNHQL